MLKSGSEKLSAKSSVAEPTPPEPVSVSAPLEKLEPVVVRPVISIVSVDAKPAIVPDHPVSLPETSQLAPLSNAREPKLVN